MRMMVGFLGWSLSFEDAFVYTLIVIDYLCVEIKRERVRVRVSERERGREKKNKPLCFA